MSKRSAVLDARDSCSGIYPSLGRLRRCPETLIKLVTAMSDACRLDSHARERTRNHWLKASRYSANSIGWRAGACVGYGHVYEPTYISMLMERHRADRTAIVHVLCVVLGPTHSRLGEGLPASAGGGGRVGTGPSHTDPPLTTRREHWWILILARFRPDTGNTQRRLIQSYLRFNPERRRIYYLIETCSTRIPKITPSA